MLITNKDNAKVKNLRLLYKDKKERQNQGVFIAEGVNFVKDIEKKAVIRQLFIKESKYEELSYLEEKYDLEALVIKDGIFDSVADTVTPSGVIAIVEKPAIKDVEGDIVILLDGIKDAGNLGTIIRTAVARGINTVISVNGTDAYSPKAVRASMGGILSINCIETDIDTALELLKGYPIVALDMGGKCIYSYKREGKIALTVGSEAQGLSEKIRMEANNIISIPMTDKIESLNAAISISIAMFLIK